MKASKPTLSQVYAEWAQQWLLATKRAKNTQRAYDLELRRWTAFLDANRQARVVTEELIQKYLDQLASTDIALLRPLGVRGPLKATSLIQSRRILGSFFLWLAMERGVPAYWVAPFKRWRPEDGRGELVAKVSRVTPRSRPEKAKGLPDARRLLAQGLACWLGASPKELSAIQKSHVKIVGNGLRVRLPSGGKQVWRNAPDALKAPWVQLRGSLGNEQWVFTSNRSLKALKPASIARLIARNGETKVAPSGGATVLKRYATQRLTEAGMTEAELLHLFRRTRLPDVPIRLRKEVFEGSFLDQVLLETVPHVS